MPKASSIENQVKARPAPYASHSKASTSGAFESSTTTESSSFNPVSNHPCPKDFKALGYPDYGDLYISQWDSSDFFGLRRDILSQHDLTLFGVKKYVLSEIYALASILQLPSGPDSQREAARRFFQKDGERKEEILGYLGLGLPAVDYTIGDECEPTGDDDEDPDYLYGPTSDVIVDPEDPFIDDERDEHELLKEAIRETKRDKLGEDFDSDVDYGSDVTDEGDPAEYFAQEIEYW